MAGVAIFHLQLLKSFLQKHNKNAVSKALFSDIDKDGIIFQLQALGLIGKVTTGPWMKLVYGNVLQKSNLELVPMFQICHQRITQMKQSSNDFFVNRSKYFSQKLVFDKVHKSLLKTTDITLLNKITSTLLSSIECVIHRQLHNYISCLLSNPTEKILKDTLSAPANNMHAERALGMTDCLLRKAPNATIGYLDSKVKAKLNHTLQWIESKPEDIQRNLIQFSITRGSQIRKAGVLESKGIDDNIKTRRIEASQKANKAFRQKLERDVKKVLLNNASVGNEMFIKVAPNQKPFLKIMLSNQSMTSHLFNHEWELDNRQDKIFYWRILTERQKDKRTVYVTSYWGFDEDSSEDFDIFIESIIADIILGKLFFEVYLTVIVYVRKKFSCSFATYKFKFIS
ncbi:uncharacterized protein LOC136082008 [Hydra vulgaris]|uniref:Uncharacterized protein LOC136082008 n=1 Tax=Hydra vulgaris TaxID=6087 RepID=A0ABM4C4X0_HYDVU